MSKKLTIYEVARLAGVSPATVSRAISGRGYVSAETREKILSVAPDFVPRHTLRSNESTQRSHVVGVIVTQNYEYFFQNSTFSSIMQGISKVLTAKGYKIMLDVSHPKSEELVSMYKSCKVDGYIFIGVSRSDSTLADLCEEGVPAVLIGDCIDSKTNPTCARVEIDDFSASKNLAEYLITMGHRKIAFISYSHTFASSYNRFLGYKSALEQAGIPYNEKFTISLDDMSEDKTINLTKHLLYQSDIPTAIVGFNGNISMAIYKAIADCGLSIPGDISVAGFDDNIFSVYATPSLTTVWQPSVEKGELAADILLEALDNGVLPSKVVTLPGMIIYRHSCAVPRQNDNISLM